MRSEIFILSCADVDELSSLVPSVKFFSVKLRIGLCASTVVSLGYDVFVGGVKSVTALKFKNKLIKLKKDNVCTNGDDMHQKTCG